jgi:hypothetical protein
MILRRTVKRSASRYDGSWLASVLRQFRGPIVLDGRVRR